MWIVLLIEADRKDTYHRGMWFEKQKSIFRLSVYKKDNTRCKFSIKSFLITFCFLGQ